MCDVDWFGVIVFDIPFGIIVWSLTAAFLYGLYITFKDLE